MLPLFVSFSHSHVLCCVDNVPFDSLSLPLFPTPLLIIIGNIIQLFFLMMLMQYLMNKDLSETSFSSSWCCVFCFWLSWICSSQLKYCSTTVTVLLMILYEDVTLDWIWAFFFFSSFCSFLSLPWLASFSSHFIPFFSSCAFFWLLHSLKSASTLCLYVGKCSKKEKDEEALENASLNGKEDRGREREGGKCTMIKMMLQLLLLKEQEENAKE